MSIKKIFIANRGEIAIRVINSCRLKGIKSVTIYTEAEKDYPHAYLSDEAYCLGEGPLSETYLNQDLLFELVKKSGADAIHPGYGFLSENSTFRNRADKEGVIFIGPSADAMELMGSKKESKVAMEKAGIPLIPGYHGDDQSSDLLFEKAKEVGFPCLIKASAGGGGKGMRIVEKESDFEEALRAAKSEAMKAFSDDKVLIEKYIVNPRHIEVQVMSDRHGNHLHFFERECSIQRRYQKIVEETPSVALDDKLRKEICETAVKISKAINYEGAGTVEFILGEDKKFFFLEMNTRLQVEHPITEMVTGHDLVDLQIRIANGEKVTLKQEDIKQTGHSIECRIYAEDPDNDFLPTVGTVENVGSSTLSGVRLDCGFAVGNKVTVNFDPMLAKLVVHAPNREQATSKMLLALDDFRFAGLTTNRDYLKRVLANENFIAGKTLTSFVEVNKEQLQPRELTDRQKALAVIGCLVSKSASTSTASNVTTTSWDHLVGFRN
jgi:acetyl/propionyl-CoA carboxylase alpha subunit